MTLETFLKRLDQALKANPAKHPARITFDLAEEVDARATFAGPKGQALGPKQYKKWWKKGGADPFVDAEGRATIKLQISHRISDWVVINAKLQASGLTVEHRHTMLRSWVVD